MLSLTNIHADCLDGKHINVAQRSEINVSLSTDTLFDLIEHVRRYVTAYASPASVWLEQVATDSSLIHNMGLACKTLLHRAHHYIVKPAKPRAVQIHMRKLL